MSFMPAGEDEDDFEMDGFINCDYPYTEEIPRFNSNEASLPKLPTTNSVSFQPNGQEKRPTQSRNGFTSTNIFSTPTPKKRSTKKKEKLSAAISAEDLRMAILKNNMDVAEKYVDLGLSADEPLRSGWTALMYAAHYAKPEFLHLLLKHGADASYSCDMFTPLMCACSATSGDAQAVEECVKILIDGGVDVNARDRYHSTPLMFASQEGYLPAVKLLIAAGAKVNMQDNQGWTALTMAAQRSRAPVVVELLEAGADPNIQHADKLTVKDLAAHLPTDDMLALLERRPVNTKEQPERLKQQAGSLSTGLTSSNCLLDTQARLTDLRYGELEVFLLGLDLGHLVGLFQDQLIDLQLLMTLTEQDLINAGVEQVGARKKILDAVQAVHKKDWQPSSLVSIHFNKQISCADAVAMVANSSRHLRYICSTMVYVREQLNKHPDSILLATDRVSPSQFLRHTEDAVKNVLALTTQIHTLKAGLTKEMSNCSAEPPDLIPSVEIQKMSAKRFFRRPRIVGTTVLLACLAAVAWWGRDYIGVGVSRVEHVVNKLVS